MRLTVIHSQKPGEMESVLVSNIGTQKSRLEKHQGGWIIDIEDPKAT